ncbi:mitochondrial distribution and morphology protein 12 [Fomes fomentarius]|nr:mitochondrial distribution and morphology protein 12 [Fomes fomentarius]
MSIDLEWNRLDSSLASTLVDLINRQLTNTNRPSFIGPIEVTSFDFGANPPDVELVDLRDIYRDFLEDDEEDEDGAHGAPAKASELSDDDDFEWVSRKAVRGKGVGEEGPAYHLLPPHMRYGMSPGVGGVGMGMDMLHSTPFLRSPRDIWSPAANRTPLMVERNVSMEELAPDSPRSTHEPLAPKPPQQPNLQLHLHVTWHSNLRLTLTTSLLINYPSPMFMSLPIKLSVTGLFFNGEVVVAYEGERKRVHLCIVDELDPYGPLGSDPEDETPGTAAGNGGARAGKPLPIGQRLLPTIYIESEIGQADKHVLKNVTRVERFIQDVIRKTIEEELVFPNFQTFVLGDQDQGSGS